MSENKETEETQFSNAQVDWLDVWDVCGIDTERIAKTRAIADERHDEKPFTLRVAVGDVSDQAERTCEGGLSIDVFAADRPINDKPLLTIRIPMSTARLRAGFMRWVPFQPPI